MAKNFLTNFKRKVDAKINKNKILLVGNTMWSMFRFRENIISHLLSHGYCVYVVATQDKFEDHLKKLGCEVISVKIHRQGLNPFLDLFTLMQLWKVYKTIQPSLVFHYTIKPNIYGSLVSSLLSIPFVCIVTGSGSAFLKSRFVSSLVTIMYRISFLRAQKVWFLNETDRSMFLARSIIKKEKTELLVGEGIDLDYYKISNKQSEHVFDFLFVGRLILEKGIYEYIEAAKQIQQKYPSTSFGILGGFDLQARQKIQEADLAERIKNIKLTYLGEHEHVEKFMEKSTCVVLPSYYNEGIPRVLLEASALERVMITTDRAGCRDVVKDDKNGYLCKSQNITSLIKQMEKILKLSPSQIKKMGRWARKHVGMKFSNKIFFKQYTKVLEDIV